MRRALPLILAVAAFFIAALIWIGSSRVASHAFAEGSALNTSPAGTSLAYAYLSRRANVNLLTTPMRNGAVPTNAVVFRIDSYGSVIGDDEDERGDKKTKAVPFFLSPADEEFVRRGGRLVLASHYFGGSIEMRDDAGKVAAKVFPIWPGLDTLSLPEALGLAPRSLPRGMHTIFAGNGEAVVARQTIGAGDVFVISVPEMFENQHLAAGHHLALLTALAEDGTTERRPLAGWTAGGSPALHAATAAEPAAVQPASRRRYEGRPIYFDEYAHGVASDDGVLALMTEWRLGPLLVLAGIAALLTFWRNARRIGPPDAEERDTRSDAIDLVASLGALYGRSMTNGDALALYRAALERTVAAQSGLRGDALHRRVADLTPGLAPTTGEKIAAHAFDRHLNTINDAFRTLERTARGGQHANHR
ncbi:MAG: hypothetical protein QOI58_2429 [Thermoanaerobaculia bacterium]|nr:hypothetical protein [Thermoanaerobaculia bacterium]